jgi:hypothetical protein
MMNTGCITVVIHSTIFSFLLSTFSIIYSSLVWFEVLTAVVMKGTGIPQTRKVIYSMKTIYKVKICKLKYALRLKVSKLMIVSCFLQ